MKTEYKYKFISGTPRDCEEILNDLARDYNLAIEYIDWLHTGPYQDADDIVIILVRYNQNHNIEGD